MSKQQRLEHKDALRQKFYAQGYSGRRHLIVTLVLLGLFTTCPLWFVKSPNLLELAIVPASFLFANLVEYILHRGPMHHKMRYLELIFEHVTIHHVFFPSEGVYAEEPADYKFLLLPPPIFIGLTVIVVGGIGVLLAVGFSLNAALLYGATGFGYYLTYELLHFSYHQDERSWVGNLPGINKLRNHHVIHHDLELMGNCNFNITFPIFDKILGTCATAAEEDIARRNRISVQ